MGSKTAVWVSAVAVSAVTVWFLVVNSEPGMPGLSEYPDLHASRGDTLAIVGNHVLYDTDLALIRAGEGAVEAWKQDQILACAAVEAGLENTALSEFVAKRAVQVYLRDLMLESIEGSTPWPSEQEVLVHMRQDPELYLVERHYYQIILADSAMADSVHARLVSGQNFQVTAGNISIGQKAGIGGDLGFVTGGEMQAQGLPDGIARLQGLSPVIRSSVGWHVFKVEETRALEDSVRAVQSAGQFIYETRVQAAIDSVIQAGLEKLPVEV